MNKYPLSLRRRLALEAWRVHENIRIEKHELRQLFWECTLRCNLNCRHCGSDCKMESTRPDMPKEDFLRVLDGIAAKTNPNKVFVILTGGEPLMRQDLEECGREIYKRGFLSRRTTLPTSPTPVPSTNTLPAGTVPFSLQVFPVSSSTLPISAMRTFLAATPIWVESLPWICRWRCSPWTGIKNFGLHNAWMIFSSS